MKKWMVALGVVFCFLVLSVSAFAVEESLPLTLSVYNGPLQDGGERNPYTLEEIEVSSDTPMEGLYLIFYDQTPILTVSAAGEEKVFECAFLRQWIPLSDLFGKGQTSVTLTFSEKTRVTELYGFSTEIPSWVQRWEVPVEKADLCLMTTHADDEQLFFAGVLPYYAGEKGLAVQVIYFTDHVNEPLRRHELLRGLWTVGVRNYPVIGPFPDLYSKSGEVAENQLNARGFFHEDIVSFQVEMLRRFQPLVVIGHDPLGEYGHGQHILNSATLREAVECSANPDSFPESAEKFGTWDVPKTYLHLYGENQITMDWDIPLDSFDGKTAFQVTQEGFACHGSQQYTWFRTWLVGTSGQITRADQIRTHSPMSYGLYRSLVGEDVAKNDFFENQMTYEEMRIKEEEERARREAEEKARLEEEARKAEEARKQKEAEEKRLREEREQKEKERTFLIVSAALLGLIFVLILVFFLLRRKKKPCDMGILE